MQPKELFGVVVRTIGLLAFVAAPILLVRSMAMESGGLFVESMVYLGVGLTLIWNAPELVDKCYHPKQSVADDT